MWGSLLLLRFYVLYSTLDPKSHQFGLIENAQVLLKITCLYAISHQSYVIVLITMFTFQQQQKIFANLLSSDNNKRCADCNSVHPTWASLDFGVFVCSNCSGAHRALGPTVTRIKSTTLDQWKKIWLDNMKIGNASANTYWQAHQQTANSKRPKMGATLEEHNRFIVDKYIKKEFVSNRNEDDPLTLFKKGTYMSNQLNESRDSVQPQPSQSAQKPIIMQVPPVTLEKKTQSAAYNLLDDLDNQDIVAVPNNANNPALSNVSEPDDEFSEFVEAEIVPQNHQENNVMTFEELMKAPQLSTHNSQPPSNQNTQSTMNSQLNIHNMYAEHSQQNYNSFHHNPFVGYVPHYNGHHSNINGGNPPNNIHHNHNFNSMPHHNGYSHYPVPTNNPTNGYMNPAQTSTPSFQSINGYQGFTLN